MRTFVWECLRLAEHQHGYGMASHGCYAGMQLYLNAMRVILRVSWVVSVQSP